MINLRVPEGVMIFSFRTFAVRDWARFMLRGGITIEAMSLVAVFRAWGLGKSRRMQCQSHVFSLLPVPVICDGDTEGRSFEDQIIAGTRIGGYMVVIWE